MVGLILRLRSGWLSVAGLDMSAVKRVGNIPIVVIDEGRMSTFIQRF